jgi:hypothetical protein
LVRSGFGTWKEILEMEKEQGLEALVEIQTILSIINQEEELDSKWQR